MLTEKQKQEQETQLWQYYAKHKDIETRNKLVLRYQNTVNYVIHKYFATAAKTVLDDMIFEGNCALVKSVERYTLDKQVSFLTYSISNINYAILNAFRVNNTLTKTQKDNLNLIDNFSTDFHKRNKRTPTADEIMDGLNFSEKQYINAIKAYLFSQINSLDETQYISEQNESVTMHHFIPDDKTKAPHEVYSDCTFVSFIKQGIKHLTKREQRVIKLYYYDNLTLPEIANQLKTTITNIINYRRVIRRKLLLFADIKLN